MSRAAVTFGLAVVLAFLAMCWWADEPHSGQRTEAVGARPEGSSPGEAGVPTIDGVDRAPASWTSWAAVGLVVLLAAAWVWIASLRAQNRRRAREVREAQARFQLIAEHMREVFWLARPPDGTLYVSPAFADIWGCPAEDVALPTLRAAIHPEDKERVDREQQRFLRERRPYEFEYRIVRADGEIRWVSERGSPATDEAGEPIIAGTFADITERRLATYERANLAEKLRAVQKAEALGRVAGSVAHDLNNMLAPILGYADLLRNMMPACYERDQIEHLYSAAERARDLVGKLLALSRKQPLHLERVNLSEIIENLQPLVRTTLREDIHIIWETCSDPCPVQVDVNQVEQVLMNLAVNAQDAMPGGGEVTIAVTTGDRAEDDPDLPAGQYALVSVTDTGTGMSETTRERLFEPFFSTKGEKGTGLGLATAYSTIRQHGGHIAVDSQPGAGATFTIYLPRVEHVDEDRPLPPRDGVEVRGSETILVVEDDDMVRDLARAVLLRLGYQVHVATNGREALALLESNDAAVELIITDVIMPDMNGGELQQEVARRYPDVRVLVISGYAGDIIARYGIANDGAAFLQKPFAASALANKVREILDDR